MTLSLMDAARALGWSPRQVRYAIRNGKIPARKVAGRWVIEQQDLPLTNGQRHARQRKAAELEQTVRDALGPHLAPAANAYSVSDLVAFQRTLTFCREAARLLEDGTHPAVCMLNDALVSLARGCHRFHARDKRAAFTEAREQAAAAVAYLHLAGSEPCALLAATVERDLMPLLSGLLRKSERKERRAV